MNTATQRRDRKVVLSFTLIAYGLAWLVMGPPWLLSQGHPLAVPLMAALMCAPATAALIAPRMVSRPVGTLREARGLRLQASKTGKCYVDGALLPQLCAVNLRQPGSAAHPVSEVGQRGGLGLARGDGGSRQGALAIHPCSLGPALLALIRMALGPC